MPKSELILSGYRGVWLFVLFDLPVVKREQRKRYTQFRGLLLADGFSQLQYSIYARYFPNDESASAIKTSIRRAVPSDGEVRLLVVTDRQFGKMESYLGKTSLLVEEPPEQMLLF